MVPGGVALFDALWSIPIHGFHPSRFEEINFAGRIRNSTVSCLSTLPSNKVKLANEVPIGHSIANTYVYLFRESNRSPLAIQLLKSLLTLDPTKRPNCSVALDMTEQILQRLVDFLDGTLRNQASLLINYPSLFKY